jgi:fucose permease
LFLSLIDNVRGPFFPDVLQDLQLNATLGSLFFAVTNLFAFVGSSTSHRIVRGNSSLYLMGISSLAMTVGFAAMSRSPSLTIMLPFCALLGWGYGALNLAQNLMISEASAPHRRRRLFSGLHSMYAFASLLAPLIASLFRDLGQGWRECFFTLALLPLGLVWFSWRWRDHQPPPQIHTERLSRHEWWGCALFSLMMAGYLWGEISVSTRLVQWLRADLSFSPELANLYLVGFAMTLFVGRLLFTFLRLNGMNNWRILLFSATAGAGVYFCGLWFSPLWFVVCGLCLAPFFPIAMEQIALSFHGKSAEALGFVLGAGSFSIVLMHVTVGALTDIFGIGRALYVGPLCLATIAVALSFKCWKTESPRLP